MNDQDPEVETEVELSAVVKCPHCGTESWLPFVLSEHNKTMLVECDECEAEYAIRAEFSVAVTEYILKPAQRRKA